MDFGKLCKLVKEFSYSLTMAELLRTLKINNARNKNFADFSKNILIVFQKNLNGNNTFSNYTNEENNYINILGKLIMPNDGGHSQNMVDVYHEHVNNVIEDSERVEVQGIFRTTNRKHKNFNITSNIIFSDNFQIFFNLVGPELFKFLLQKSCMFYKNKNKHYIQLNGKSFIKYFENVNKIRNDIILNNPGNDNENYNNNIETTENNDANIFNVEGLISDRQRINFIRNIKFKERLQQERQNIILNRNFILYCNHSNRRMDIFHKSFLYKLKKTLLLNRKKEDGKYVYNGNILNQCVAQLSKSIFGNIVIERKTLSNLNILVKKFLLNYCKLDIHKIVKGICPIGKEYYENYKGVNDFINKFNESNTMDDQELKKYFTVFLELYTPQEKIIKSLLKLFKKLFPRDLFGGDNNISVIKRYIYKVVSNKRFENILYEELLEQLDYCKLKFYERKNNKIFLSEIRQNKKYIMRSIIFFMFNEFYLNFIRINFYVTEKHKEHNKLFFYQMPVWHVISSLALISMKSSNIKNINFEGNNIIEKRNSMKSMMADTPCAKLRFVPKKDSARPIMTFYKKFMDFETKRETRMTQYLKKPKIVLRILKDKLSRGSYFSVFDNYMIFRKYEEFKKKWEANGKKKLYYFTMDIKQCYDSVSLTNLYKFLMDSDLLDDEYLISTIHKIMRNKRYFFADEKSKNLNFTNLFLSKQKEYAKRLSEIDDNNLYFYDEISKLNNTVYMESSEKEFFSKEELLAKIEAICKKIIIRHNNKVYNLNRGLPQGLSISAVLSSFYYHCLEQIYVGEFIKNLESNGELFMVMRLTDDYFILSEKQENIITFLEKMTLCAKENNFAFNTSKFTSNFDFEFNGEKILKDDENKITWIGKIVDLSTLEIEHNQIEDPAEAFNSINCNLNYNELNPWEIVKAKLKNFITNQNVFYFNLEINSYNKIKSNFYNIVKFVYYKLNVFFKRLFFVKKKIDSSVIYYIARKIFEALGDCAMVIIEAIKLSDKSYDNNKTFIELINVSATAFIYSLSSDIVCKNKKLLYKFMKEILNKINKRNNLCHLKMTLVK